MKSVFLFVMILVTASAAVTQEQAQSVLDTAIASADEVVASILVFPSSEEAAPTLVPIWSSKKEVEVRSLSRHFRLIIPRSYRPWGCGCYGSFVVALKKQGEVLLEFTVYHGKSIGSSMLVEHSQISVDPAALAPFYSRMMQIKEEANGVSVAD